MALRAVLQSAIFKDATLNIGWRIDGIEGVEDMEWQSATILTCAASVRQLVVEAPTLAERTERDVLIAIDHVIRRFYPQHKLWYNPALLRLLEEKAALIEQASAKEPVEMPILESAFEFCEQMWIALAALEMKEHRESR